MQHIMQIAKIDKYIVMAVNKYPLWRKFQGLIPIFVTFW